MGTSRLNTIISGVDIEKAVIRPPLNTTSTDQEIKDYGSYINTRKNNFEISSVSASSAIISGSTMAVVSSDNESKEESMKSIDASLLFDFCDEDGVIIGHHLITTSCVPNKLVNQTNLASAAHYFATQFNESIPDGALSEDFIPRIKELANSKVIFTGKHNGKPQEATLADAELSLTSTILQGDNTCNITNIGDNMLVIINGKAPHIVKHMYGPRHSYGHKKTYKLHEVNQRADKNDEQSISMHDILLRKKNIKLSDDDIVLNLTPGVWKEFKVDTGDREKNMYLMEEETVIDKDQLEDLFRKTDFNPQAIAKEIYEHVSKNLKPEEGGNSATVSVVQVPNKKVELIRALIESPEKVPNVLRRLAAVLHQQRNSDGEEKTVKAGNFCESALRRLKEEKIIPLDKDGRRVCRINQVKYDPAYKPDQLKIAKLMIDLLDQKKFVYDYDGNHIEQSIFDDLTNEFIKTVLLLAQTLTNLPETKTLKKDMQQEFVKVLNRTENPLSIAEREIVFTLFPIHFPKLNEHTHDFIDDFFGIKNTKSWRKVIASVRKDAKVQCGKEVAEAHGAKGQLQVLEVASNKDIFISHKNNFKLFGAFGKTKALREIEKEKKKIIKEENNKLKNNPFF